MATYASILTWEIPWMEGRSRLHFMGLQRVKHDRVASLSALKLQGNYNMKGGHCVYLLVPGIPCTKISMFSDELGLVHSCGLCDHFGRE